MLLRSALLPALARTTRRATRLSVLWLAIFGLVGLADLAGIAHAVEFGHARLLSASGQALRADIVLTQLRAQDMAGLQVHVAPETAWQQADLTPPVALSSLQIQVHDGLRDGVKIVRLTSSEAFAGAVADFLIDVQTAAGVRRHQVSVLTQHRALTLPASAGNAPPAARGQTVIVRRGDMLFAIAQRAAVPGFSVYQMMAALFAANPRAFIDGNMNLVRAGAVLHLPDATLLARLTDRQARQLFVLHAQAYARRRGAGAAALNATAVQGITQDADAAGQPVDESQPVRAPAPETRIAQDQLRLSAGGTTSDHLDAESAPANGRVAVQDSLGRIAQLEENIQDLTQVLQALTPSQAQAGSVNPIRQINVVAEQSDAQAPLQSVGQGDQALTAGDVSPAQTHSANAVQSANPANQEGATPVLADPMTTGQSASLAIHGEVKRGISHPEPKVPPNGGGEAPTVRSEFFTQGRFPASPETAVPANSANGDGMQADTAAAQASAQASQEEQTPQAGQGGSVLSVPSAAQAAQILPAPALPGAPTGQNAAASTPAQAGQQITTPATQETGVGKSLWIMVAAGLALLAVLLVMWLRRRARADEGGKITDAMIQEKLNLFDLNLRQEDAPRKP